MITIEQYRQTLEPHLPPPLLEEACACAATADRMRRCGLFRFVIGGEHYEELTPATAILRGFLWEDSKSGDGVWAEIYQRVATNTQLQDT